MYVLHVSAFRHLQVLYIIYFSAHALVTNNYIKYYVVIDYKIIKVVRLYEISSSHSGEYEVQICLLGCTAV
jgi:hypothetical protein